MKAGELELLGCKQGWLMALKNSDESVWGSVRRFYSDLRRNKTNPIRIRTKVWGRLYRSGLTPNAGDGIAFYHASRAVFPKPDLYHRRPRISAIGLLDDIKYDDREVKWISFRVWRASLDFLASHPLVRTRETEQLFLQCGMKHGTAGTYWDIPRKSWLEILKHCKIANTAVVTARNGSGYAENDDSVLTEAKAIAFVSDTYKAKGWQVTSVEADNVGYDLIASKKGQTRHLEVKGVSGEAQAFFMTPNERASALNDKHFKLCVVLQVHSAPVIHEWTGVDLMNRFAFRTVQYHVTLKR
jgi:Protein NO VEIN, C-terminal